MTAPALVVPPVVFKFDILSLQSDRLLWRVNTLMHGRCMAQVWCIRCTSTWAVFQQVCDLCVLEKIDKSIIYTARFHDLSRIFLLILTIQFFLQGGDEEKRGEGRRERRGEDGREEGPTLPPLGQLGKQ